MKWDERVLFIIMCIIAIEYDVNCNQMQIILNTTIIFHLTKTTYRI